MSERAFMRFAGRRADAKRSRGTEKEIVQLELETTGQLRLLDPFFVHDVKNQVIG